jgi:signal transduction histidine kinase
LRGRLAEQIEIAAYHAVSEALSNIARHAHASEAKVDVTADEDALRIHVFDDGRGGADFGRGSGLTGMKDRVEAYGGRLALRSPLQEGTALDVVLPLAGPAEAGSQVQAGRPGAGS